MVTRMINIWKNKVDGATSYNAYANVVDFVDELGSRDVEFTQLSVPGEGGWYGYYLHRRGHGGTVLWMPGAPIKDVRITDPNHPFPFKFYRLKVDWNGEDKAPFLWMNAIEIMRKLLHIGSESEGDSEGA